MTEEMPCKHCKMNWDQHAEGFDWCPNQLLGLKYLRSYTPMDNLDYVEYVAKAKGLI
jgi:hypothetical protein